MRGWFWMNKAALVQALRAQLALQAQTMQRAADKARDAATHEESRPENDKDTRALESSYLAGGQAAKARELQAAQNALAFMVLRDFSPSDAIAASAVVRVLRAGQVSHYFLVAQGGGEKVTVDGVAVVVVTPASALGVALLGRRVGDVVSVGGREVEIDAIF